MTLRRPSASMVVAAAALLVAIGGSAVGPGVAVDRCPGGGRAVGGGVVGNPFHETEAGYPLVVDGVPVGWAIVPAQKQRFTVIPSRRESTSLLTGLPRHRHSFTTEAHLLPLASRAFSTTVDVYAECLRLPVAIPERPR